MPLDEDEAGGGNGAASAAGDQQKIAAQTTMQDFTRNIQRKKDREMEALQFVGGEASSSPTTVQSGAKVGRNDPCPCGSGKKYKKCHGA
jgi:preprotein translocase subunit SecA